MRESFAKWQNGVFDFENTPSLNCRSPGRFIYRGSVSGPDFGVDRDFDPVWLAWDF